MEKLEIERPRAESDYQKEDGITWRGVVCVITFFFINLLNYMDRYTVAGVLTRIQSYYDIDDAMGGFLQTVFIIFFMTFAPISGFLADRYARKWIVAAGLVVWVGAVLLSSFVPANAFFAFLLLRGVVGIGEASYAIVAPTIIADLFANNTRSRVLMFFYFAIPLGSGLGYVVGNFMATLTDQWQWGVRVTPFFGVICLLALVFIIPEPERGASEGVERGSKAKSSYWEDIKYLISVKTYVWAVIGYTGVVFVTGTLSWWAPSAIEYSKAAIAGLNSTSQLSDGEQYEVSITFGGITCLGGILGVTAGVILAQWWKEGRTPCISRWKTQRADALICGLGSALALPFMVVGLRLIYTNIVIGWICIFLSIFFLCFNWAINVDMILYIVVPHRRNTANSWQITLSHLFGDASGPYIIGLVSDWLRKGDSPLAHYEGLLNAFYVCVIALVISAVFFFASAYTIVNDIDRFNIDLQVFKKRTPKVGDISMLNGRSSGLVSVD